MLLVFGRRSYMSTVPNYKQERVIIMLGSTCDVKKGLVKRKRVVLSLKEKLDIINAVRDGGSRVELAEKYDIGISTIADILKRSNELQEYTGTNQKAMKCPTYHEMEDALYMWYQLMQTSGEPVTGALLCEKALGFNKKMNGDSAFKASHGWLHRFKVRRGIHLDNSQKKSEAGEACNGVGGEGGAAERAMPSDEEIIQRCLVAVKSEFPRRSEAAPGADDTPDAYLDSSTGFIRRPKKRKIIVNKSRTDRLLTSLEDMKKKKLALEIEQLELRNHLCRIEIFQAERLNALTPSVYTESMYRNLPAPLTEVYVSNGRDTPSDVKPHSRPPTPQEDLEL